MSADEPIDGHVAEDDARAREPDLEPLGVEPMQLGLEREVPVEARLPEPHGAVLYRGVERPVRGTLAVRRTEISAQRRAAPLDRDDVARREERAKRGGVWERGATHMDVPTESPQRRKLEVEPR